MLEYIRETDLEKWNGVQEYNNIAQYKGIPGVWILLGREKGDTRLVCLQAGKTTRGIGDEIKTDISYLKNANFHSTTKKEYVNQFGESMFEYEEHINERRKKLYWEIAQKYDGLTFVCVAHGKELKKELLEAIEKYVAYKTLCRYWVNGGPYVGEKTSAKIKKIKNGCANECKKLFETIKKDNPQAADSLNNFLDMLINGKIDSLIHRA